MNSKVSFFNLNYLIENFKKSRGVILLFIFVIPIFTYLFMLLLNNSMSGTTYFPALADISIPSLLGMYIVPFTMAVTLFNFLFKKDSVDFINALPLKRSTVFITNIIGGIFIFLLIFLITSLIMFITSAFFPSLVIPKMMYIHFFITFFIAYCYTFLASCLALSLTGSRMAHVALTLIILFIPGFISDFYGSRVYDVKSMGYQYPVCDRYDGNCTTSKKYNEFSVKESFKFENGQTLPYKYVSVVPRALFGMQNNEITFENELSSVYNLTSILRMIVLSIIYFTLGLYAYINRKMEVAETTFKSENVHQIVKCLTLFPLCLGAISIFSQEGSLIALLIMLAIIITIYTVYDLITRRNSGKFMVSVIYFLSLILSTMIIYIVLEQTANLEASKVINKDDVASIGVAPNVYFDGTEANAYINILKTKLDDKVIIDLIFANLGRQIDVEDLGDEFAVRLNLKNGASYYFNMYFPKDDYKKLLDLLDMEENYTRNLKYIPYNKVYGVKLGNTYLDQKQAKKIVTLIEEGYKNLTVSDIVNANYPSYKDGYISQYNLMNTLYVYEGGIKTYLVSTMINPELINYVMQTFNKQYITDIRDKNININRLSISLGYSNNEDMKEFEQYFYQFMQYGINREIVYRYINDNIKSDIDFSKYDEEELLYLNVWLENKTYDVFLPKDDTFVKLFNLVKENASNNPGMSGVIEGQI